MSEKSRRQLWLEAHRQYRRRATCAKFLFGTHHDRQTGAPTTHRYRREMGVCWTAPREHADGATRGSDGQSRASTWTRNTRKGIRALTPLAERIKARTYRPQSLKLARWQKPNGRGMRVVAVPTVHDRLVGAVLLEILEPIIDPILSPFQHGYRPTMVAGQRVAIPGFPGIPRGSTEIVARRLLRAVRAGYIHVVEMDIVNAFPSVLRGKLKSMLIADGCPQAFANVILQSLGTRAIDPDQDGKVIPVTGIPLGNPIGPLLFNFFVAGVHEVPTPGILVSFADNFFLAARSGDDLDEGIQQIHVALDDLGLTAERVQRWSVGTDRPLGILKEHLILRGRDGKVVIQPRPKSKMRNGICQRL